MASENRSAKTTSRGSGDDDDALTSAKQVLAVLRQHGIKVSRRTLHSWRNHRSKRCRPPVKLDVAGNRPVVHASRQRLIQWIERMKQDGFDGFSRSRSIRATRREREEIKERVRRNSSA